MSETKDFLNSFTPSNKTLIKDKNDFLSSFSPSEKSLFADFKSIEGEYKLDSQYDLSLRQGMDQEENRAQQQYILDKWSNGIVKAAGIAGTSALENTAGLVYGIGSAINNKDISKMYNNDFTESLTSFNDELAKSMPNYHTKAEKDYNLIQKLGTANFWSDQALNGLGFMAGSVATGMALGEFASLSKLAKAGIVVNEERLALEGSKYLKELAKPIKIANKIDFGKNAVIMSVGESAQEANGIYKESKNNLIENYKIKFNKEPDELALKQIESDAKAASNFGYAANIAITGTVNALFFSKLLSKGFGDNKLKLNDIELKNGKYVSESIGATKGLLSKAGEGVLEEGGQESAQLMIEKTLTDYYSQGFKDKKDQHGMVESILEGLKSTLGSEEGLESFFLGALLGGPGAAIQNRGSITEKNNRSQQMATIMNSDKFKKTVNTFDNFVRSSNYEKQKDEALKSGSKFDYITAEFNQNKSIAKHFLDNGGKELLIQQYKDMQSMSEDDFKAVAGYDIEKPLPNPQSTIIGNAIKFVENIDATNNSIKELVPYNKQLHGSPDKYNALVDNLLHYSTSIENMDKRTRDIKNEIYKIATDKSVDIAGDGIVIPFSVEGNPLATEQVKQLNDDLITAKKYKEELIKSYKLLFDKTTQKKTLEKIVKTAEKESTKSTDTFKAKTAEDFDNEGNPDLAEMNEDPFGANDDTEIKPNEDKPVDLYSLIENATTNEELDKIKLQAGEIADGEMSSEFFDLIDEIRNKRSKIATPSVVKLDNTPKEEVIETTPVVTSIKSDEKDSGKEMFPNTRTVVKTTTSSKSVPNEKREELSVLTKGQLLSSSEVQSLIDSKGEQWINDNITIDAVDFKGAKSVRIKLGNSILGYFRPAEYHTLQIQQLIAGIKIGDVLDNNAVKKLGFNLAITNGFVSNSNEALTLDKLENVARTANGEYIIFDQGTVYARSQNLSPELITDPALEKDEHGTMKPMNLGRYVLKFFDKSGNEKFLSLQTSTLSKEEFDGYFNSLINRSNEVAGKTITQSELDEENKTAKDEVFISISKSKLKGEQLELIIDISTKGAIRIQAFKYESDGKLFNKPSLVGYINRNEISTDSNYMLERINSILKDKGADIQLTKESFKHSVPKQTTLKDKDKIESLFVAYTKPSILEGQDVLININQQAADLNTIEPKTNEVVIVVDTKPIVKSVKETSAERIAREKAEMQSTILNKPDIKDEGALKMSDKEADELIDTDEISELGRIVPKDIPIELRKDLRETLKNVSETKTPWGFVGNKVIKLFYQSGKGTGFHEAFHAIFRFAISDLDVNRYLKLAEKEVLFKLNTQEKLNSALSELRASNADYQDLTPKQIYELLLEEYMADKYMDYTQSENSVRTSSGLKQLFRRIKNLVKHLLGINNTLEAFFDKIDRGAFQSTKAVANKQTFVTSKVYKNLSTGKDTFMTSAKSKKIINTFAARVKQISRKAENTLSKEEILSNLINERIDNLQTKAYDYIDSLENESEKIKLELSRKEELFTLINPEANNLLLDQINKRLDLFDSKNSIDEIEDDNEGEDNDKGGENGFGSKESWTISLEEGTNKVVREYIAFAMYEVVDELTNEKVLLSVDNQTIYNGLAHVLANTAESEMMNKFIKYAKNNPQAKAVLDMIMSDTGMTYDNKGLISSPTKNFNDLRRIITAFKNVKVEFTYTSFEPEFNAETGLLDKNEPKVTNANKNTPEKISMSKWANALININKSGRIETKENISNAKANIEKENKKDAEGKPLIITEEDIKQKAREDFWNDKTLVIRKTLKSGKLLDIQKAFEDIGISLSLGYIEYSVYANKNESELTEDEKSYLAAWKDITPLNADIFTIGAFSFKGILTLDKNPYNTGKEGMSSKLESIAISNAEFDESIQSSNFKGADGNTRYDIIKGSYVLDEILRLRNKSYRDKLVAKYPILKNNLLLKNSKLLEKLKIKLISGVRDQSSDDEGKSFGDYSEREYIYQHLGYWFAQKNGKANTLFRQNEASNTAYVAELDVDSYIDEKGEIEDKAIEYVYSFFNSEFERIQKEQIKGFGNIKGYNDRPSGRAFRFTEFASLINFIGPVKYNAILDVTKMLGGELSQEQIKEVKSAIKLNLKNQIKEFKSLLQSNGFAKFDKEGNITTNDLLPTHLKEAKLSYKDLNIQLSEMYLNDYINSFSLNQLFDGDYALSRDDKGGVERTVSLMDGQLVDDPNGTKVIVPKVDIGIDIVKRHKGAMGSGSDLGEGTHKVAFIRDVNVFVDGSKDGQLIRSDKGEKINSNDAQSYTNINHIMFMTERLGRFSGEVKSILRKIRRGVDITSKEQESLEAAQASLNPWKTVTFGREFYVKTSEAVISRHQVSIISDMKKYNEIMDMIEKIEDISTKGLNKNDWSQLNNELLKLYTPIKGKEFYHNMLNQMDIHGIDQIVTESASKGMTIDPQDSLSADLDLSISMIDIPNSYKRLQVETPTGKNVITSGTQLMQLIDSEQKDSTPVSVNGKVTNIGDVRREYRQAMANTRNNSFKLAEAYLKDGTNNEGLKKKFIKTLESSGADDQLLELFEKNWNLLPVIDKAEQLFLSHFGGGVMAQKVPGTKVSLMSDAHWNVVVDKNNKVVLNKVVKLGGHNNNETRKLLHNTKDPITDQIYSECILSEKVFSKFGLKIGDTIPIELATMLGYRIPTQDKHSMISLRVVDVLPNYLEGTGIFPSEIVYLSGADFDIDSLFIQQHSFTMIDGKPVKAGTEKSIDQKWNSFKTYVNKNKLIQSEIKDRRDNSLYASSYKELSKIKKNDRTKNEVTDLNFINDKIFELVLTYFKLPANKEEYAKAIKDGDILNNDILNNEILDSELALLTNDAMKDIALSPVSSKPLEDEAKYIQELKGTLNSLVNSSSSLLGKIKANIQNSAGKAGIGPVANGLQAFTLLAKNKLFRVGKNRLSVDGVSLSNFNYLNSLGTRIADTLSTVLSVMTDNAKDPIAGKMGLSLEVLSAYNYMLSLGVSLRQASLIINTPSIQMYAKILKENKYSLKSKEEKFKATKTKIDELFNTILGVDKKYNVNVNQYKEEYIGSDINTTNLDKVISSGLTKENANINIQMLVKFMQIEEEAAIFKDLNNIIKLTKGLPTSFSDIDNGLIESLYNLGLDSKFELDPRDEKIAPVVDILNAIDNDPLLKQNIDSAIKIINQSQDVFISQTKPFKKQFEKIINNIKSNIKPDLIKEIKRSLLGFISTNAYVKLKKERFAEFNVSNDSLIFPELGTTLAKKLIILQNSKNDKIKNNPLIKWLKPELKFNEKEELNDKMHVYDKVSGKSFIKLSQESINDLVNSYQDLWNDEETHQFAIDLFHYLITKDNLEYKNDSFVKYISPFVFNNISEALNVELKGLNNGELSQELNYQAKEFRKILASYKPTQDTYIQSVKGKDVGMNTIDKNTLSFNQKSNRSMFKSKIIQKPSGPETLYKFPEFIIVKIGKLNKLFQNEIGEKIMDWNTEANYVEVKSAGYKAISPFSKATYEDFIETYNKIEESKNVRKAKLEGKLDPSLINGADEAYYIDNDLIVPDFELEGNTDLNMMDSEEENPFGVVDKTENFDYAKLTTQPSTSFEKEQVNKLQNKDKKVILFKDEKTNSGVKVSQLYSEDVWNTFEQIKKDYIKKCN